MIMILLKNIRTFLNDLIQIQYVFSKLIKK